MQDLLRNNAASLLPERSSRQRRLCGRRTSTARIPAARIAHPVLDVLSPIARFRSQSSPSVAPGGSRLRLRWRGAQPVRCTGSTSPSPGRTSGWLACVAACVTFAGVMGRNYAKTALLMGGLIGLLVAIGNYLGGPQGMLLWGSIGLLFNLGSYWFSDRVALMVNRAQPVSRDELPVVHEIVEELVGRAGMPIPGIYLIPSESPNAFATGRNPHHSAVAVTEGILRILNRRQLRAVLAHELSHVRNRDILIATVAAAVAGRSEEHTSELQSLAYLVCRLLLEKKKNKYEIGHTQEISVLA